MVGTYKPLRHIHCQDISVLDIKVKLYNLYITSKLFTILPKTFMIFLDFSAAGPTENKKQKNKQMSVIYNSLDDLCSQMEVQTTSKSFGKKRRERYSCSFCGKLYLTKQGLELHRPSHMGIKPFICSYCNKGFSQNGVLKVRLSKVNSS